MFVKRILNDLIFFASYLTFLIYDTVWRLILLPLLEFVKDICRTPVHACLPQRDPNQSMRFVLQRNDATYYRPEPEGFIHVPEFRYFIFVLKEFFINIILASPLLLFSIFNFFNDGRVIKNKTQLKSLVRSFWLKDSFEEITDDNCYELNTAFEIIKKLSSDTVLQNKIHALVSQSISYNANVQEVLENIGLNKYYTHDCTPINDTQPFDVYGLFVPYTTDKGQNRLTLKVIVQADKINSKVYIFVPCDKNWIIMRNNYINWIRTYSSVYLHQLGSNVYCSNALYHIKTTLSESHPLCVMMKPFLEGIYLTNNVFMDFGINNVYHEDTLANQYMSSVELFDVSNDTMVTALKEVHNKYGKTILDYPSIFAANQIKDIDFSQKEHLEKLYQIIYDLVESIVSHYYKHCDDMTGDYELQAFIRRLTEDLQIINILDKNDLIKYFANIIYLASVRHSQSHVNFGYLASHNDYGLRKTNIVVLNNILNSDPEYVFDETFLYSTYGDFYSKYTSALYPSVPVNRFGQGYGNLFTDQKVNGYFVKMTDKLNKIIAGIKHRNNFSEFMFRLQNSNTI